MKNPLTPAGIEPATFRFVAQHLNHCATAVPAIIYTDREILWLSSYKNKHNQVTPRSRFHPEKLTDLHLVEILPVIGNPKVYYSILIHGPLLLYQRISLSPRSYEIFRNMLRSDGKELLAPRPTPKLEDHPLSAVRDCLFNIFAATSHNGRSFLHPQPDDKTNIMFKKISNRKTCPFFY